MTPEGKRIYDLSLSCAKAVYGNNPPSDAYAARVAQLLTGTAATESALRYRRQHGFSWNNDRGAWGLWQIEQISAKDSMRWLAANPAARTRAVRWLFQQDNIEGWQFFDNMNTERIIRLISGWDRIAVLFARVHYIKFPEAVPASVEAQAAYWKKYYNTHLGKGTVDKYIRDWHRHVGD